MLARDHVRAEEHLQGSLLAQLTQRSAQRLRANMDAVGRRGRRQGGTDRKRQRQGRPTGDFIVVHDKFFHVEPSPVIARVCGC